MRNGSYYNLLYADVTQLVRGMALKMLVLWVRIPPSAPVESKIKNSKFDFYKKILYNIYVKIKKGT